ncbi:5-methylcytosine restriction system specificity protein McrC [Sorangium sp. So ce117]|uniref:5-methylcytosine restriction system specificity protein McrC n=1 Tax=Sorangium sp. So ce117 TaxID=3133277 RepID=UPI003F60EE06
MMAALEIVENETFSGLSDRELAHLECRLRGRLERRRGGYAVVRRVGHVVLPGGRLLRIRSSKAPAHALLAWLGYVDPTLQSFSANGIAPHLADTGDLASLLARLYVGALLQACARCGLHRDYRRASVRGASVRGRIEFSRLIADGHNLAKLPCATWTRAADTPLNRFLAAALRRVVADPCMRTAAEDGVAAAARLFQGIPAEVTEALLRPRVHLQRSQEAFQEASELARCILQHGGLGDGFGLPGLAFVIDLERLFERAVLRAFSDAPHACEPKRVVQYTARTRSEAERRSMQLDLLCHSPDGQIVVDAKFKHEVRADDVQQMVTYCFLTGARRAALILPGNDMSGEIYELRSPSGASLEVRVVRLDTCATSVSAWQSNAASMVERVVAAAPAAAASR